MQKMHEAREHDEGINFSDIVRALKRLKYFFLGMILVTVAAIIAVVGFRPGSDDPVTFFVELISIKNKAYPNGAAFSPNDILSADVLDAIKNKYGISDYKKLREAISVDYGSPAVEGVSRKYSDQLAQKNLTQADIATINNNFAQELSGVNEKGLRISVEPKHLGVSDAIAKQILIELPRQWSDFSINKYKIFEDKFLSTVDIPENKTKFTDATNVMIAYKIINQMRDGIKHSLNDNRIVAIKTESNKSAADLFIEIDRYFSIYFMPIFSYYNKKDELVFANYIDEIKLRISEVDAQIAGVNSIVDAIRQERGHDRSSTSSFDGQKGPEVVQLGEGGIKNILELSERASLSAYLKDTLENKRLLIVERSKLQSELDRLTKYNAADRVVSDDFVNNSEEMLSNIISDYSQLLQKSRHKLESDQKLLYVPIGAPVSPGLFSRTTVLQVIGLCGVSMLLCLLLVAMNVLRKE
jgi:hypothetical protein